MTQTQVVRTLRRKHWRVLERFIKKAYADGVEAGITRAHGQGRRGRTIRADATVNGLMRRIERHFGLDRYRFRIQVVHPGSGHRVPGRDTLSKYRIPKKR